MAKAFEVGEEVSVPVGAVGLMLHGVVEEIDHRGGARVRLTHLVRMNISEVQRRRGRKKSAEA